MNFAGFGERDDWRVEFLDRAGNDGGMRRRFPELASR